MNLKKIAILLVAFLCLSSCLNWASPAIAANQYPVPLSYSNAQLKGKDFSGQQLRSAEFSNANLESTDFSNADLRGAVISASTLTKTILHGADLTYAMVDQVNFNGVDLRDAILVEALLLRSTFKNVDITGADFTDALLGKIQVQQLCQQAAGINSKTGVATADSLGCATK